MIGKVIRWFLGTVRCRVLVPDRIAFLNCLEETVRFAALTTDGDELCFHVAPSDYKKTAKLVRSFHGRCRVIEKRGFVFWKRRFRHREGLLLGALFLFFVLLTAPQFIWEVQLPDLPEEALCHMEQLLAEEGIGVGMKKSALDPIGSADRMLHKADELGWITLNQTGSVLEVKATLRTDPPPYRPQIPCDLVAARAGIIHRIEVLTGVPVVEEGDVVLKGELLISGMTTGPSDFRFTPTASVIAKTVRCKEVFVSNLRTERQTGSSSFYHTVSVMGVRIPLYLSFLREEEENKTVSVSTVPLIFGTHTLPFSFETVTETPYEEVERVLDKDEMQQAAEEEFTRFEEEELKNTVILSVEKEKYQTKDGIRFRFCYQVLEEITQKAVQGIGTE